MFLILENVSDKKPENEFESQVFCFTCGRDITDEPKYSKLGSGKMECKKCYFKK